VDLSGVKPRPRVLLRYLALHAGRLVHREVLTEALWPDADAEGAKAQLQVAVSTLRKALGADLAVERQGDAYRLAVPDGARIDVVEFERALEEGRTARARGDDARGAAAFARALA